MRLHLLELLRHVKRRASALVERAPVRTVRQQQLYGVQRALLRRVMQGGPLTAVGLVHAQRRPVREQQLDHGEMLGLHLCCTGEDQSVSCMRSQIRQWGEVWQLTAVCSAVRPRSVLALACTRCGVGSGRTAPR